MINKYILGMLLVLLSLAGTVTEARAEELTPGELEAMNFAIQDEYKAEAFYAAVLEKFGDVSPFSRIIQAERRHIQALKNIYEHYEAEAPANEWNSKDFVYDSVNDACKDAVAAEEQNAILYDEVLKKIDKKDIRYVFRNLQEASKDRHLKAFKRCVFRYKMESGEEF